MRMITRLMRLQATALCQAGGSGLGGRSPTYAAHDAHDPPAGVIAPTCALHGRPPSAVWPVLLGGDQIWCLAVGDRAQKQEQQQLDVMWGLGMTGGCAMRSPRPAGGWGGEFWERGQRSLLPRLLLPRRQALPCVCSLVGGYRTQGAGYLFPSLLEQLSIDERGARCRVDEAGRGRRTAHGGPGQTKKHAAGVCVRGVCSV